MRTINKVAMKYNMTFICINHLAKDIGSYIQQENPVGGRAPMYLSDIIIKLTSKTSDFEKQNLGKRVEFEVIKSRFGLGKVKIPFYIRYGMGISMIPTYREVLDKISTTFNGEPRKVLEMRGGGNGSLFINNEELKFRGEAQLLNLIYDHYKEIKDLVPWTVFTVQHQSSELFDVIDDLSEQDVIKKLPKSLSKIKVNSVLQNKVYFIKGVDKTGQEYYIYYDIDNDLLKLVYDTDDGLEKYNPSTSDYNNMIKILNDYLKKCE